MNSKVEWMTVPERYGDIEFSGRLCAADLMNLGLDHMERAVVMSPIKSASDLFQTLEIIWRRIEQKAAEKEAVAQVGVVR